MVFSMGARVLVSDQAERSALRLNFPVTVLGNEATNSISRGYLYGAIILLAWA
jgi:hypothetical protein